MLNARLSSPLTVSQAASLLYKDSFTLIFCYSGCAGQTFVAVIKKIPKKLFKRKAGGMVLLVMSEAAVSGRLALLLLGLRGRGQCGTNTLMPWWPGSGVAG